MVLRKVSVCVLVLAAFAALSAKFCMAAPVKLPKPEPVYFPLLTGLHGKSAILARMDLAVNPKGTTAEQVLAAYVGVRNGTAHPRWITAQVCHLVRVGSGAAAKPLFARTPTAVEFWREQFSGPASLMGSLLSRGGNASFRFPWELRAGPLAGCGWLLVPQPGGGGSMGRLLGPLLQNPSPWGPVAGSFCFIFRRDGGRFRVLGYNDLPRNDPFWAVCQRVATAGARDALPRVRASFLKGYVRADFRAARGGCELAKKGQRSQFSLFFRLRSAPKALLSAVRDFLRASRSGNGKVKVFTDLFGPATSDFLKSAKGIRLVWTIQGRRVCYVLFSGLHRGTRQFWIAKILRTPRGNTVYLRRNSGKKGPRLPIKVL